MFTSRAQECLCVCVWGELREFMNDKKNAVPSSESVPVRVVIWGTCGMRTGMIPGATFNHGGCFNFFWSDCELCYILTSHPTQTELFCYWISQDAARIYMQDVLLYVRCYRAVCW